MAIPEKISEILEPINLQVFTVIFVIGLLMIGMVFGGYGETEERSNILCLSCLGLDPKTVLDFRFDTANGEEHPDFVLTPLKNKPVFLDYSSDGCAACDAMRPKIEELHEEYEDKITFIPEINLDHTSDEKKASYDLYDIQEKNAVPLFVIITNGYADGMVKPYFAVGYGYLNEDNTDDAKNVIAEIFENAIEIYDQNKG